MSRGVHECGWCASWRELLEAFDDGRKAEALKEACRRIDKLEGLDCTLVIPVLRRLGLPTALADKKD